MGDMNGYGGNRPDYKGADPAAGNPHSISTKGGADASPSALGTTLEALSSIFESDPKPQPTPQQMLAEASKRTGVQPIPSMTPFRNVG